MRLKVGFVGFLLLVFAGTASAQITIPNVFTSGTTIKASEVNANFTAVGTGALNRTGGTMTGNLPFGSDNTNDIGASGATRPRRIYVGTEVVSPLFTGSISGTTGTFSGALQGLSLALGGAITGATTINASGTVTGGTFSGSGASLSSIPETALTDGAVYPRLAGTETVSGDWTFSHGTTPITVSTGTSAFQAVTGTTANFSSTVTGATFSGSGASLTSIPETAITDGSVLARVGSTETVSGSWTFSGTAPVAGSVSMKPLLDATFVDFLGDYDEFQIGNAYPSGQSVLALAPGSRPAYLNSANLIGTYQIEVVMRGTTGTMTGYACVVNISDASDTCLTGSEITASNPGVTGGIYRSSNITWTGTGYIWYGVKVKTSSASEGLAIMARLVRVG